MDSKAQLRISTLVWDMTIGAGNNSERPTKTQWAELEMHVGHTLDASEKKWVMHKWEQFTTEMAQP